MSATTSCFTNVSQFATLTPLEPRLIKKLLPPLTSLIRTTPAMSLLYECINGIIQGGILEGAEGTLEVEEIASLCVGKLRGMIVVEGDPNRASAHSGFKSYADSDTVKYVALLAFNRIVASHSHLVSMHHDVILDCIDDMDISIRLQALDLSTEMVDSDNLGAVVERLIRQLASAPMSTQIADDDRPIATGVEPAADSDGEDPEEILKPTTEQQHDMPSLPAEYRASTILRIIEMCSKDTYVNIVDFEWYVNVLTRLVKLVPTLDRDSLWGQADGARNAQSWQSSGETEIASIIGWELRNVAVRVSTVRVDVILAAYSLMASYASDRLTRSGTVSDGVLGFAAWVVGEYIDTCSPSDVDLEPLIHNKARSLPPTVISAYLQAIPKVLASLVSRRPAWSSESRTMVSLLVTRVIQFLEPLTTHPSIEVQERSVEFVELMRLILQATANHDMHNGHGPLLLTKALPQLFDGFALNPVAPTAQRKVPLPDELDLEKPITQDLTALLQRAELDNSPCTNGIDFNLFYNQRPAQGQANGPAFDTVPTLESEPQSYQQAGTTRPSGEALLQQRLQRREKNKNDPFYIGIDDPSSRPSTPFHDILQNANGEDLDVDSIPIMNLDLGDNGVISGSSDRETRKAKRKRGSQVHVVKDENIETDNPEENPSVNVSGTINQNTALRQYPRDKAKKSLLQVDSSGLSTLSLTGDRVASDLLEVEKRELQDEEMAKALAEVERLRLEMQRASERVQATDGTPPEGTFVKKKRRKKSKPPIEEAEERSTEPDQFHSSQIMENAPAMKKKKKKRKEDQQ